MEFKHLRVLVNFPDNPIQAKVIDLEFTEMQHVYVASEVMSYQQMTQAMLDTWRKQGHISLIDMYGNVHNFPVGKARFTAFVQTRTIAPEGVANLAEYRAKRIAEDVEVDEDE